MNTKAPELPPTGHTKMRPRARIISLIGEELISDERVAVVELVKNAYDADADRVEVRFDGKNPLIPDTLIISDNGVGMTLETVLSSWFEPGTVMKKKNLRSPGGRLYQGAKGIGRFAAARLGASMFMETKSAKQKEGVTVLLNWGRFDDESYLDEIELDYSKGPVPIEGHGTRLTLMDLRRAGKWDDDDFKAMHDRLSRLISPFGDVKDFDINLVIPAHPELSGPVESHELTQKPKYTLKGELHSDGTFTGEMLVDGKSHHKYKNHRLGKKGETVACGGFSFEIRAWDRDRPGLTPYMLEYNLGLSAVRAILDVYSGVSLYRDGFRVHPYGESGNDWLQLDNRSRQQPTVRLANNQIIAAVRLSRESNPQLMDRAAREGLIHNAAYDALTDWFVRVLGILEEERYRLRPREEKSVEEVHTLFEAFDLTPVVKEADRQLGREHPVSQLVRKSEADIRDGVKKLQEHYSRLLMTAGLGQMVDLVIHEIGAPVGRANRDVSHLEKLLQRVLKGTEKSQALEALSSLKSQLEQIFTLRSRLDPKTAGKRGRATTFNVEDEVTGNLMLFETLLANQGITPHLCKPKEPVVVHMARSALGQVLANLLDNSIYWLTRHHGDGKGGQIEIRWGHLDSGFHISVSDDGPGVDQADRERIFDPYFTTKPSGMGLGLYIGRQVMDRYGRLLYKDDGKLSGACFEARFERNVGL